MGTIREFSGQVVDVAERVADIADAAQGKGIRRGGMGVRWVVLSAAGAGLYALATSDAVTGRVKNVMHDAKERAIELPEDLLVRVRQTTKPAGTSSRNGGTRTQRSKSTRQRSSTSRSRSRKTASAR
jgi:hypothetical protein